MIKLISPEELKGKLKSQESIQLIDIRERYEYEEGAICKENIPLEQMMTSVDKIVKDRPVIIYCQSGKRSSSIIYMLEKEFKFNNLYSLDGGYKAYSEI